MDHTTKMRIAFGAMIGGAVVVRVLESACIFAREDGKTALTVLGFLLFLWLMPGWKK